jgi:steroid 5-alpha reductase family enzyme
MPVPIVVFILLGFGAVIWMVAFYGLRRMVHNAGIVDAGWALGVGLTAIVCAATGSGEPFRRLLLVLLAGTWSFRLGLFLLRDRVFRGKEDGRYQSLMNLWGERAEWKLFRLFLVQAIFIVLFSLPFFPIVGSRVRPFVFWDILALAVWLTAVAGESLADRQLAFWRANPENRGHTCRHGLWRYSRHPNYFFEWLHWWTYVFLSVGSSWWWLTLLGPALMLFLLYRITGIPYTEAQALRSRGEDYADYQRTTSAFFPWFPRHPTQ